MVKLKKDKDGSIWINYVDFMKFCQQIINNDKSDMYSYGEARPSDSKKPAKGQRWLKPTEIVEEWRREVLKS